LAAAAAVLGTAAAPATADLQSKLDEKQSQLDQAQQKQGVQSERLEALGADIDELTGQVAALRNREASVRARLAEVQTRLDSASAELRIARERLSRAKHGLRQQLVSIYKAGEGDVVTVILSSEGYDEMLGRAAYMSSIQESGEELAAKIAELRDQKRSTVETVRDARDEIAARQAELERTRAALEAREHELVEAQKQERKALARTRTRVGSLQGDVSDLEKKVRAQLQAAQAESATTGGTVAATPGASEPSSSGLIWPVSGSVTSPFGPRWGSMHEGIDIGAAEGTPIQAADSGSVVMAGWNGGYGNYTCIDHGGGFSTCYAHQSVIGVSVGQQVEQGEVIGEVGNTGHSFGAHLHFETRVNGVAQDPLGYL
jgi:murein DD-endopeptidase MepM/ murein hydrolase activator NlpD